MAALTAELAWGLMATVPVGTQGTTTPTITPATPAMVVEHLDRLLASKDYMGLTKAIVEPSDAAALRTNLDWLRDRMTDRVTAAKREREGDVAFACTAGLEETSYNLKNGTAREVLAKPGQIGRQVLLSGDGRYHPSERPETEWRPAMARARATLPALFRQLQGTATNR